MAVPTETPVPERESEVVTETSTPTPPAAKAKPKPRPGGSRKPAAKAPASKTKQKKGPALYHLFSRNEKGVLTPVGDETAMNAEAAVTSFVKEPPSGQASFAKKVGDGSAEVVVIPERNFTVVGAEREVKETIRIKARK